MTDRDDRRREWRTSRYDDDRPRWSHDERDDYDDDRARSSPERVRQKIKAPAMSLIIVGCLLMVGSGIGLLVCLGILLEVDGPRPRDSVVIGILAAFACIGVTVGWVIALGGHRMYHCRSHRLAMTGAAFCIGSIIMGVWSVFILPFGIWAIVVLTQADVKREFERVRRATAQDVQDDYEDRR